MEKKFKRTTVTSALPYANGPVHIGHLAGVYVPADIYVRYLRLKKEDVLFIGGSDEHGVPITIRAKKEGITPQDVVDRYHSLIKKSFEEFGISFDVYSRTTSPTHHQLASDFFKTLYDKGEFIEKTSEQYYDEEAKTFLADRYITGECPHCHSEGAYGDQCEKCGTSLSPTDLINPKSAISGSKPVMKETKHWYLPLDKHEAWLRKWILEDHKEWFRRRLRRPMRKMRNLTFSYGSYQPEKCYQRQQTGDERNQTLVSSSRQARRMAAQMDSGRSQRMASQRIRSMQKLARHGSATTCRKP